MDNIKRESLLIKKGKIARDILTAKKNLRVALDKLDAVNKEIEEFDKIKKMGS